jgi:tetratricopeptide (TPR) repeat protein
LLARHGRVGEAIDVLRPHLEDSFLLQALADVTKGHGRDAEVAELIRPMVECAIHSRKPWNAAILLSQVLERQGRVDEAVEFLDAHIDACDDGNVNMVEEYAGLLARQDRMAELRAFVAGPHGAYAVSALADRLAELGRVDEAVEVLRPLTETSRRVVGTLVALLGRNGRLDEAIAAARPELADADCSCMLVSLLKLMADHGRAEDALGLLTDISLNADPDLRDSLTHSRIWLLGETGRPDEAMAEAQALAENGYPSRAATVARLLAQEGRLDEAIAVLQESSSTRGSDRHALAHLLIRQGRPGEAIELRRLPVPDVPVPDDPWATALA